MPHLADKILTPSRFSAEGVLFDVPLRPYPGKPIVCMLPVEDKAGAEFVFQGRNIQLELPKEVADKYAPDFGVVAKFEPRRDDKGNILYRHDQELFELMKQGPVLVAVKPYTGNWYTHSDFDWIPEGRTMKILGTVEDWSENILAAVEI